MPNLINAATGIVEFKDPFKKKNIKSITFEISKNIFDETRPIEYEARIRFARGGTKACKI